MMRRVILRVGVLRLRVRVISSVLRLLVMIQSRRLDLLMVTRLLVGGVVMLNYFMLVDIRVILRVMDGWCIVRVIGM